MTPSTLITSFALTAGVLAAALGAAIVFGGPTTPAQMASINEPFKALDFSDLPALQHFVAKDGASLAYRLYRTSATPANGSVVFVHGSSASSNSMHILAKAFAKAGYDAYALDVRGHGASGVKGQIGYIGQLEDDLESFAHAVTLQKPATLAGFSSGGGFVLRFAGSPRQDIFQNYLLLSPFLSQDAPTYRPDGGGWVKVGIPRLIAISILNGFGIRAFNDLPVTRFALNEEAKAFLTPEYSYSLAQNFRPLADYEANIRAAMQPVAVLAGTADEAFHTDKLQDTFRKQGKNWTVTLLPGIGHIPLTLEPSAVNAAVKAVSDMR